VAFRLRRWTSLRRNCIPVPPRSLTSWGKKWSFFSFAPEPALPKEIQVNYSTIFSWSSPPPVIALFFVSRNCFLYYVYVSHSAGLPSTACLRKAMIRFEMIFPTLSRALFTVPPSLKEPPTAMHPRIYKSLFPLRTAPIAQLNRPQFPPPAFSNDFSLYTPFGSLDRSLSTHV